MELFKRLKVLVCIVQGLSNNELIGRGKFHKIVYLMQKRGSHTNYTYKFGYHGIFSIELAHEINIALDMGLLIEKADDKTYKVRTTDKSEKILNEVIGNFINPVNMEILTELDNLNYEILRHLSNMVFFYYGHKLKYEDDFRSKIIGMENKLVESDFKEAYKLANKYFLK